MKSDLPKVVKDAQRARACIYESVSRMPRRHKYGVGQQLDASAEAVVMAINDFWREAEPVRKLEFAREMCRQIDRLMFRLQLANEVHAFRSFAEFESVARIVAEVGSQSGGLRKGLERKSQNAAAATAPPMQRALTLSARNASHAGARS
jgi:hypothetical protein